MFPLLLSSSISVVQAASDCLPRVLATKTAATVLSKLEDMYDWTKFLHPFKPQKKKVCVHVYTISTEKNYRYMLLAVCIYFLNVQTVSSQTAAILTTTTTSIDISSLWIPQCHHGNLSDNAVHEPWITGLVTSLLESGSVSDQCLLLVKPVCQVKVR